MATAVTKINAPNSRRKWQLASLLLLACAVGVTAAPAKADQLEKVKERGKLVVGIKTDYPPFGYLDTDGQVKGFEIDIAKFVAKELLGSADAIELVPVVASNRIELLNAGRIDAIFATLGTNPDRAKIIDFTHEYYQMEGMVLLTGKDNPVKAWEEVKGKKLCGIQGNLYNRSLTEKFGAETVLFAGTAEMFKAFQDNRCEGIAFDGPILTMKLVEDGWKDKSGTVNLMLSGQNLAHKFRLCCLQACDPIPHLHGGGPEFAVVIGRNIVTRNVKEVGDWVMNGNETL